MVVLNFVVRGSVLSARDKLPQVTTRSNKFFTLNVELDDVWSEYTVTVFFSNKAKPDAAEDVFPVLLHDGSCIVPHEVLDASDITAYMWLMGLKDDVRATTNIIAIPLTASGYLEGVAPEEPTPDVYTEILESVRGAYNIANDVRADADAGKFNGKPGPKGDPGEGVPTGGATGQVLTKASDADYDTEWRTPSGGGSGNITVDAALSGTSTNPVQNKVIKAALDGKAGTGVATPSANGLMPAADKIKLDGVEDGATKTIVDDAISGTSTNPVQNKAVKAALDSKLSTRGGEISASLEVGQTVSAGGSVSVGRTSSDTGIHFEKAASDAGRVSHGSDSMTGVAPIARLKVASPTEDDDAATKAYVDGRAVRYDAAQTLDEAQQFQARKNIGAVGDHSPQFTGFLSLAPANGTLGIGVGLSPSRDGNNFALDISDVNENTPTLLTGVKTPTDTDTNAAATVEYVKDKIASGGVTPHIGDNGNWYIGPTDTGKPSRGAQGAKGDTGPAGPQGPAGAPGKDGAGMDITGATVGQIAKITAVDASGVPTAWSSVDMPSGGGSADAVLYTPQTLTDEQKKQARENVDAAIGDFEITARSNTPGSVVIENSTFTEILAAIQSGKRAHIALSLAALTYSLEMIAYSTNSIYFATVRPMAGSRSTGYLVQINSDNSALMERAYVPNLDGHDFPQQTMASAPTEDNQISTKKYVDDTAGKKLNQTEPVIKEGLTIENTGGFAVRVQPENPTSATGEDFAGLDFSDATSQASGSGVVLSGLANFGDAEMVGLEDTAVSYAQLMDYTKPLMLTYDNNKVTGASYYEIRKAIERGRQIKLAVANTTDIIAANAKNETDKSVLKFIDTEVGGDTVFIQQYNVTAQASGLTVAVKSIELP